MPFGSPGNQFNHPTKEDRIKHIRKLDTEGLLSKIDLSQLSMKDLYEIELKLELQQRKP